MTAYELADELDNWYPTVNLCRHSANMLRQQAQEINNLKRDLKWAREQWGKDKINLVHQMDIKDIVIEQLKSKIQYWKAREK